jgi:hypothetical protein
MAIVVLHDNNGSLPSSLISSSIHPGTVLKKMLNSESI